MRWLVIAVLGVAAVGAAVIFRDEIQDLFGAGDRSETVFYRFDGPVPPAVVERARTLLAERLSDLPVTVRVDGARLAVDVPDVTMTMEVAMRMDDLARFVPRLELRILDYDPPYFQQIKRPLRANARAKELGVELKIDRFGHHLAAPTAGMYVNTAWAEAHGCPTTHRLEGTGVYCVVSGAQRIRAVLHGDEALFAEPVAPGVRLPSDRELIVDEQVTTARAYLYDARPIVLEAATVPRAEAFGATLALSLSPDAEREIAARATGPAIQLVHLVGGSPREAKLLPGGGLELAIDPADARTFVNALSFSQLPQRLREAPTP